MSDGYLDGLKALPPVPPDVIDCALSELAGGFARLEALARAHPDEVRAFMTAGCAYGNEALIGQIRDVYDIPPDVSVIPVGGTSAFALTLATVSPGGLVLYEKPGYKPFGDAAGDLGFRTAPLPRDPAAGFAVDVDRLRAAARDGCRLAVVSTPSNPAGAELSEDEVRAAADALAAPGPRESDPGLLVVDETFVAPTAGRVRSLVNAAPNVAVVCSFSKGWGLAALRLGFVAVRPPFAVKIRNRWVSLFNANGALAESLATLALLHRGVFAGDYRRITDANRAVLRAGVARAGGRMICTVPAEGLTAWVDVPGVDPDVLAADLLADAKVRVLSGALFGLPSGFRIGLGMALDAQGNSSKFAEAVRRIVDHLA
ncbi:MAG: pyridoxal phosphate-dependent aminotransferase [Phycisphaerae bacterium]